MTQPSATLPPHPLTLEPIGIDQLPLPGEICGAPPTPEAVTCASARLGYAPYNDPQTLRGIEQFSHLWLIFQFHECAEQGGTPRYALPDWVGTNRLACLPAEPLPSQWLGTLCG